MSKPNEEQIEHLKMQREAEKLAAAIDLFTDYVPNESGVTLTRGLLRKVAGALYLGAAAHGRAAELAGPMPTKGRAP